MTSTTDTRTAEVVPIHDMVVIHRIFRREFPRLAQLVRQCPDGHVAWARGIAGHADFVMAALHNHHTVEDEYLRPLLLDRARPQRDLVHRMEHQHEVVAARLARTQSMLAGWRGSPTATTGGDLADSLMLLSDALVEHLDDEESDILPLVSTHITVAEWQEIGERSFAKFSNAEKLIALGQLLDVTSPDEASSFLEGLPLPTRMVWRLAGRRRYARHVRRVDGDLNHSMRRWMRRANRVAVPLYQHSGGRVGGTAKGSPVMLLSVAGRRTGIVHTVPIAYLRHDRDLVVAGTAGGAKTEPQWFRNVRAAEHVHVQLGSTEYEARCRVPDADERDRLWHDVVLAQAPSFTTYEKRGERPIPLAVLTTDQAVAP
jgi:deazaflavin-dependent oxidoreductase (nitroreductase family)